MSSPPSCTDYNGDAGYRNAAVTPVIVRMRRRAPDEPVEQFRQRTCRPAGEQLAEQLAEWAAANEDRIGDPWPTMPAGVADRPADVWEPLLAVADLAGGDWPKRAREACLAFVTGAHDDVASVGVRLLTEIRDVWPGSGTPGTSGTPLASTVPHVPEVPAVGTDDLLARLHHLDEAPWGDWYGKPLDARGLAKLLKGYGIKSTKVKIGDRSVRGYRREDFWDAWRRYLSPGGVTAATSATPLASTVAEVAEVAHTRQEPEPPLSATAATSATALASKVADVAQVAPTPGVLPCLVCRRWAGADHYAETGHLPVTATSPEPEPPPGKDYCVPCGMPLPRHTSSCSTLKEKP